MACDLCFLVATDLSSGALFASAAPEKGPGETGSNYVVTALARWTRELGYTRFKLQGDKEPALEAVLDAVAKKCCPDGGALAGAATARADGEPPEQRRSREGRADSAGPYQNVCCTS